MNQIDSSSPFLPLPDGIVIASIQAEPSQVIVHVRGTHPTATCPLCGQLSERVHGSYVRTVADLPCGGRRVILKLWTRKFVCSTAICLRKIFTERISELVQSYARMTNRLSEMLQTLGFATCGEMGERLAPKLGMRVSGPTILRRMRDRVYTPPSSVPIVGIDDWAWKKGQTYGTLVVDLKSRRSIELLPDRSAETAEAWLRDHPEITVVSRDRGGDYAAAARRAAPQAQQVADKFHLLKNLRERLADVATRRHSNLPIVAEVRSDAIPVRARDRKSPQRSTDTEAAGAEGSEKHYRTIPPTPYARPPCDPTLEVQKQERRARRVGLYEDVHMLFEQGVGIRAIARQLKICRQAVRRYLRAEAFPEKAPLPRRGSLLDQHKLYIFQRWQQGCRNSVQLYDEIKARGYSGSTSLLRNFLATLRKKHLESGSAAALLFDEVSGRLEVKANLPLLPHATRRMSPTRASWLMVSRKEKLDERQRQSVEQIRQSHLDLEVAYQLAQQFVLMLAEHRVEDLDAWLVRAEGSGIPELRKMAKGIRQDDAAVRATFTSEWSNGQVEAQVNCLKLQKRIVFGRANFDLLRLRVLCRI